MTNEDVIVENLIREAFTSGPSNTTKGNGMAEKGGTTRQMLSGEQMGSSAWPFQQANSPLFKGSTELQQSQSEEGQGELTDKPPTMLKTVSESILDELLEGSPAFIYSDKESVGYLINSLEENGYINQAKTLNRICEGYDEKSPLEILTMVDELQKDNANAFLVEKLIEFGNGLIELINENNAS